MAESAKNNAAFAGICKLKSTNPWTSRPKHPRDAASSTQDRVSPCQARKLRIAPRQSSRTNAVAVAKPRIPHSTRVWTKSLWASFTHKFVKKLLKEGYTTEKVPSPHPRNG